MSIPEVLIAGSGWELAGYEKYEIADGKIVEAKVNVGKVVFDGRICKVGVLSSHSKDILIGTKLLTNKILNINFKTKSVIVRDN